MSDVCGPSNAGKSLVTHAERDRSLHQDRFVNRPSGGGVADVGSSFHAQAQRANAAAAETSYQTFMNTQVTMPTPGHAFTPMNAAATLQATNAEALARAPYGGIVQPQMPPSFHPAGGAAFSAYPAARVDESAWVRDFANSQVGPAASTNVAAITPALRSAGLPPTAMNPAMMPGAAFAPMHTGPGYFSNPYAMGAGPSHFTQLNDASHVMAPAHPIVAAHNDEAQFSDAFADFADAKFDDDVTDTSTVRGETTEASDFQAEMDKWMAEHHPRNETKDYYMDDMTATMNSLALEQEVKEALAEEPKIQQDQELKRAAASILDSVADNTSQKFQQSSFLALMKRIAEEQVVLKGEDLVEAATGAAYKVSLEPAQPTKE
ncbi:hypothetical protein GQ53DRAFT_513984 [Thozetella sp. PMI_491]|nr:hypothetical protein GQ53DRAFT_513984 [Thozetella sp. PMI_491]